MYRLRCAHRIVLCSKALELLLGFFEEMICLYVAALDCGAFLEESSETVNNSVDFLSKHRTLQTVWCTCLNLAPWNSSLMSFGLKSKHTSNRLDSNLGYLHVPVVNLLRFWQWIGNETTASCVYYVSYSVAFWVCGEHACTKSTASSNIRSELRVKDKTGQLLVLRKSGSIL
jgi:hypothetical protein